MSNRESILAGWLIDGSGGPVRENILLSIEDGCIDCIETAVPQAIPRKDLTDISHCTVLPGLIDAHVHLFMSGTEDLDIREKQLNLAFDEVKEGIQQRIGSLMACGVVACRDGGDRRALTMRYKRDCLAEKRLPIQLNVAGAAWHRRGRYGKMIGNSLKGSDGLGNSIRKNSRFIDHIKIVNSGLNSLLHFGKETSPQFDVPELREAVTIGESLGYKIMVHANGKKPVEGALKAGCHSIEHGFFMGEDNLKRMADQQIFWVPTAVTMKAYEDILNRRSKNLAFQNRSTEPSIPQIKEKAQGALKNLEHQLEQLSSARQLGVPIAVGTDSGSPGVYHGPSLSQEIRLMTTAGFSIEETIQCACANGARLLGLNDYGRIAKGMAATFVAVAGPPQDLPDNLDRIAALFIKGREYPIHNASTG
jgi:imidazolonepropionase-like amidohydrolase